MLLPKTLSFIGMVAAFFFATAVAEDPQKPLDESRFIGEPMCLNQHKHDSGLDNHNACQQAIDALFRQGDGITGLKGNCKELSRAGNCIVALCNPTNIQAKLDPKMIAAVAQGIHGYCKVGPADDRWTGGSTFTYGLQPWGEERLGATIYLGQFYATPRPELGSCGPPTCQNRRALAAKRAFANLSARTPLAHSLLPRAPLTHSLPPRAVGDTADVGGGWRLRVLDVGRWQTSSATGGHMSILGDMLVQNWNQVQPGQGANAVTVTMTPTPDYSLTLQLRAGNNHAVDEVNQLWRTDIRRVFRDLWIAEGNPGVFNVALERVTTLADPPFSLVEVYADLMFMESRINRGANQVPVGMKIVLGQDGIVYGSFEPIS